MNIQLRKQILVFLNEYNIYVFKIVPNKKHNLQSCLGYEKQEVITNIDIITEIQLWLSPWIVTSCTSNYKVLIDSFFGPIKESFLFNLALD